LSYTAQILAKPRALPQPRWIPAANKQPQHGF
jgi:hypothetical protein